MPTITQPKPGVVRIEERTMHTPGPWHVDGIHVGSKTYIVARVEAFEPRAECEANARLIAAAPELLAALQDAAAVMEEHAEILTRSGGGHFLAKAVVDARAAIAKAKGM